MDSSKVSPPQEAKLHFLDYWRIIRIRKTVILAVFLLVVITATLVTLVLPNWYSSTARIVVQRDQPDVTGLSTPSYSSVYDPYFIETEFQVIKSEQILTNVIDKLNLRQEWGTRYNNGTPITAELAMTYLKLWMDLAPERNTAVIDIGFRSEKADDAARIANTIAETYKAYRLEKSTSTVKGGISALEKELADRQLAVSNRQSKMDELRIKLQVAGTVVSSDVPTPRYTTAAISQIDSMRIQGLSELANYETLLAKLKGLSNEDLVVTIPTLSVPDPILNSLLDQKTAADQNRIRLEKDYGPLSPELINANQLVSYLDRRIQDTAKGYVLAVEMNAAKLTAYITTLSNAVEQAKQEDIKIATDTRDYFIAQRDLEQDKKFTELLQIKVLQEKTDSYIPKTKVVEIIDTAKPVWTPVRPNKTLNIVLGVIIGLVVGVGLAFFIEYLDTSVKTIDDVERTLQSPVLGVIPQNVGLILDEGAESPHAEAYRVLRTNLLFSRKDDKLNTVAVISAGAGEGKSTTVFNLAAVFAQSGQRVLVVDSDLRRPTLHKMLRVANNIGLTNYLLKQNTLEEVIQTTSLPTLDFMASGKLPSSSLGILSSAQMREFITELKQHYDFVFFDSPPVMGVSDASILASEVDMTLQVIQYRRYPQPMNIRAKQLIEKVGGNLVGIVLNNINMSQDESYYYYSGYYHDYYSRNEDQEPTPPAAGPAKAS